MKEVTIKSKIVGREGSGTGVPSPSSPSASVDLSLYLKKEVWDDAFELKETEDGVPYLFGKLPVLLQYGLTMYADSEQVRVPSLFDGIPIDNNTIYWDETTNADGSVTRVLKAKGVAGEGGSATLLGDLKNVGEWANAIATEDRIMVQKKGSDQWVSLSLKDLGTASFENVKESGEGNAFTSFTLSEDKKTLTFVKGDSFIKKADFDTLNTKVTDFLEGSDTDGIINKWKELEAFLEGMKQSDDLATILATKWTKDDTKIANWDAAFGWGDHSKAGYSTKTYVDETFVTLKTVQTITGKKDFTTGGLFVNGSQIVYDSTNGYWKLDGDLLVTGAITMFANEGKYTPSTIMDAISVDGTTIMNDGTKLFLNPNLEFGGGGISSLTINLGSTSYKGTGTSDVSVSLPAYPTSLKNPTELTITLADGTTKTVYDGSEAKSIALTRLWKASEVTSATSDEGTITPLAMNQWTTSRYVTAIGTKGNSLTYTKDGSLKEITVPYATTANQLTKWKVLTIKKNKDAGTVYKLIANLSNWKTGYNGQWGMVGMMYGHRVGNMAGTTIQKIVAYCAAWSSGNGGADYELKTDITTYVKPCIVSYNGVSYLALRMTSSGSSREHSFLGYTENLLEEFIEVAESSATLVHDTEVMSMGGVNAASASKLQTQITIWGQSFDGTENVSGAITGATTGSFSDKVSMKSASVDGISIYKSSTGVLRIDGDVVLSGALTMFGTDSVNTSTIMDGVNVDGTTIIKSGNKLMINPELELGGGGLDEAALASYLSSWAGSSSIKNVGTITSGTWNGSKIANAYLANSAITISGESVSLGGSLSQAKLRTALGLGSNAYTSTSYLPSTSYTAADVLAKLKTVDGADSGLDADLLDGYHVSRFPLLNAVCGSSYDLNNADRAGYYNVSMSTNRPSEAYGYGMMETIEVHTGVSDSEKCTLQVYYPHQATSSYKYYGMAVRMRNGASNATNNVWGDWRYFVTKDGNVASATTASKLATVSKTAWGQTYWTSGGVPTSISGDMTGVGSITMSGSINYNDYAVFRYSASVGDGGVPTGASLLGSPSLATTLRSSGNDLYHWNAANSAKYLIFDTNNFTDYTNKALTKKNSGTNLLTDGDKYIGAQAYLMGYYTYNSSVTNGVKYRCTLCGKLGDENTNIAAYWDGGSGNHTTILGLSSTEERTISFTATITNKQRLSFYQFPNGKFGSYIKWCKLEVEEDVTGDTSTYLYNIDRIDFANDSNSHNFGIDRNGTVYGYNAGVLKLRRGISSGGSFVQYEANNQTVYGWRAGADNSYKFSWWYYDTSAGTDICKMKLTSAGVLSSDYWMLNNTVTNPYLKLTHTYNSTTYTHYLQGFQGYLYLGAGSSKSLRIDGSGNCLAIGGITMYSDIRKKTKLKDVELTLVQVAEAPLIEHYYNSDEKKTTHVGSIAQYWAGINDWFCKKDGEGFYTMEIQNAALASAISVARELSRFESDTDRRIRLLEEENEELRREIEQLKNK